MEGLSTLFLNLPTSRQGVGSLLKGRLSALFFRSNMIVSHLARDPQVEHLYTSYSTVLPSGEQGAQTLEPSFFQHNDDQAIGLFSVGQNKRWQYLTPRSTSFTTETVLHHL